jgi:DNA-binding transcriptional LysR family regulator
VVVTAAHPFARLKSVPLEKVAAEPLISLRRQDYREYLNRIFAPTGVKPRIAVQCDTFGSLLIEVEAGHGIALGIPIFKLAAANRLLYRPLTGTTEALSVGIARARKGDVTPAGEKFCEILRKISAARAIRRRRSGKIMTETAEGNLNEKSLTYVGYDEACNQRNGINGLNGHPRKLVRGVPL